VAKVGTTRFRGDQGEALVASWLERQGFCIVARNVRLGPLEIDIVAREGPVVALVEVRTRGPTALTSGLSSVGKAKQARLRRAGERLWNRRFKRDPTCTRLRYDLAAVSWTPGGVTLEYVRGAFY
jgi:putative endonuclease